MPAYEEPPVLPGDSYFFKIVSFETIPLLKTGKDAIIKGNIMEGEYHYG